MGARVQGGAESKGHCLRAEAPLQSRLAVASGGTSDAAETMLMLRRGLSLKVFRKRADKACAREKAKQ